jgi:DNA-binding GntR family transcriptional regulator
MNTQQINLTDLEQTLLTELISGLYAEEGFSDVDAKDLAQGTGINIKIVRGALGSLVKKGVIGIEETETWGVPKSEQYQIIYLSEAYWYMHPRWGKEQG